MIAEAASEGVLLLRLNRPEQRNALNIATRKELAENLESAAEDPKVRAVVLTGDERAFAAGADLREMAEVGPIEMMERGVGKIWDRIAAFPKPLIAAVNGYALGGGCELAMHCDIVIAGESAKFGQPEVKVGILAGGGGTQRLMRAVGKHKAMLILMSGDPVTAAEADAMGLVSRVVPDDQVVDHSVELAGKIARRAPIAVQATKDVAVAGQDMSLPAALKLERRALWVLLASEDRKEGVDAFFEGRAPQFRGK
ncbi:enoyl-CoA hydratase-related protein [Roseovarius sp.]|uniref:enoyl-CoA hydratase-related protein n=1 Tax=Roseovarius sp. TaxID=1486281 RepID=UPI003565383D